MDLNREEYVGYHQWLEVYVMKIEKIEESLLIHKAIEFAALKHKHGMRKGSDIPYIVHPFEVGLILQENGADLETIIAGILHDTLEDTNTTDIEIKEIFGEKVAEYVLGASEKLENRSNTPWRERKEHTVNYLSENIPLEIKLIACADKLSNIRSMKIDFDRLGDELWKRFRVGYDDQRWYYNELINSLERINQYDMYKEFVYLVNSVFSFPV